MAPKGKMGQDKWLLKENWVRINGSFGSKGTLGQDKWLLWVSTGHIGKIFLKLKYTLL
jgi:hypothetical protein